MCLNCGCGQLEERHGHPENITSADLRRAAKVNGQSLGATARNLAEGADRVARSEMTVPSSAVGASQPRR
jgi:hypothetical protein